MGFSVGLGSFVIYYCIDCSGVCEAKSSSNTV